MTGGPKATLRVCRSKGISHLTVSHGASLALHSRRQKPRCPRSGVSTFDVYTREQMPLAAGDVVRFTKNFVAKGGKCRNNDLANGSNRHQ